MNKIFLSLVVIFLTLGVHAQGVKLGALKVSITGSIVTKDSIDSDGYESSLVVSGSKFEGINKDGFEFKVKDEEDNIIDLSSDVKFKALVTKNEIDSMQWVSPVVKNIGNRKILEFEAENGGVVKKFDKPITIVQYFN